MKSKLTRFVALTFIAISLSGSGAISGTTGGIANGQDAGQAKTVVGAQAKDFQLQAVAGSLQGDVRLSELVKDGPVALVVLRGYPGYQCGICSRQVGEFVANAKAFAGKNAKVVMIYPGPDNGLEARAKAFLKGSNLPEPLSLLLDPGYEFTNAYGLRWNAPRETAYPSTFVIGPDGVIAYAKVSKGHGGRVSVKEVLANL